MKVLFLIISSLATGWSASIGGSTITDVGQGGDAFEDGVFKNGDTPLYPGTLDAVRTSQKNFIGTGSYISKIGESVGKATGTDKLVTGVVKLAKGGATVLTGKTGVLEKGGELAMLTVDKTADENSKLAETTAVLDEATSFLKL